MLKHSIIYSISNFATKASGLILLPVYTKYFTVGEFGRLALLLATTLIISQIVILGQSHSIVRFSTLKEYSGQKRSIFFSLGLALGIALAIFVGLSELVLNFCSFNLNSDIPYIYYFRICLYLIVFMVLNNFILNKFRSEEKSILYTSLNLIKLVITIALTLILIISYNLNIESVLYAQLTGEAVSFICALPYILKDIELKFSNNILRKSLKFGMPLVFSVFALNFLNVGDRYIIKYLAGEFYVGIFELSSKISGIHHMFLIVPFSLSFLPKAYKIYKTEGDKEYYKNLMSYFTFILLWGGLFISLYGDTIIKLFVSDSSYYPAGEIVPVLILGNVFMGMSLISSLGMYLAGESVKVAMINLLSAALLVGLNFISIPSFGYHGSAISKAITFFVLFVISLIASNKIIKISYEYKRIIILFLTTSIFYFFGSIFPESNLYLFFSFILFLSYPLFLWIINFYKPYEKKIISDVVKRIVKIK